MQDWSGNKQSIFTTLGASNHVEYERAEYDYYATEPVAMELLLQEEMYNLAADMAELQILGEEHFDKLNTNKSEPF